MLAGNLRENLIVQFDDQIRVSTHAKLINLFVGVFVMFGGVQHLTKHTDKSLKGYQICTVGGKRSYVQTVNLQCSINAAGEMQRSSSISS